MAKKSQKTGNTRKQTGGNNKGSKNSGIGTYKRSDTSKSTGSGPGPKKTE